LPNLDYETTGYRKRMGTMEKGEKDKHIEILNFFFPAFFAF